MDVFSSLLPQFGLTANVFHTGALCGVAQFDDHGSAGHFHLLRAGRLRLREKTGPDVVLVEPTVLFYTRPAQHLLVPDDVNVDILCASVEFSGGGNPVLASLPDRVLVPLRAIPELGLSLELLFGEAFGSGLGRQAIVDRVCEVVIIQLVRHLVTDGQIRAGILGGLADPRLSKAIVAIHNEPSRRWTLHELARTSAMSRSSFATAFRRVVGVPPGDYLSHVRMSRARKLLRQDLSIAKVAQEVGFANQPAFTRAFTRCFGLAPSEWARRGGSPVTEW